MCRPEELKAEAVNALHIQLGKEGFTDDEAKELVRTLKEHEGYTNVYLTMAGHPGEELQAGPSCFVSYSLNLLSELRDMSIVEKVWVS